MKRMSRLGLPLVLAMALGMAGAAQSRQAPCARPQSQAAAASRIAGEWTADDRSVVPATKPPLPPGATDAGLASAGMHLDRMLLLLQPSPAQTSALDAFLAAQQAPGSCAWHRWMSPAAFADAYANSAADVNAMVAWLQQAGFSVAPLPSGRGWIEFSGTVAQVESAFKTPVRSSTTAAGARPVIAGDISVPSALRPLIQGLVSLDGVVAAPAMTAMLPVSIAPSDLAAETSAANAAALTPALAAQLLHLDPLHAAGTLGSGETIAIAARSNVQARDVEAFRAAFGLPANPVAVMLAGDDPGMTADRAEAEFAASWAGAAAPVAKIVVAPSATTAATDGVDLSLASLIDGGTAHTIVAGFSACEAAMSASHRAFYAALYRQAAAEGITVIAAAGDSGASACHAAGSTSPVTTGYAVNALASTPWNTAAGVAKNASSNPADLAAWSPATPAEAAYAGGGGVSRAYAVPDWQGAPDRSGRVLPDVSLPTASDSAFSRGLAFCFSEGSATGGCTLMRSGGSSAAAALFGGISALLAQRYGPQGNLAPQLYGLRSQPGVFQDIAEGNTQLACDTGTPGCDATGRIGYQAGDGFDLATGLGMPNAEQMVNVWARPAVGTGGTQVLLTIAPTVANATYNPSAQITYTATVNPAPSGPTPTGSIQFNDTALTTALGTVPLNSSGVAVLNLTGGLATGGNNITAVYSGDPTYASNSSAPVTVTIQKSTNGLTVAPSSTTVGPGGTLTVTVSISVGIPAAGTVAPSGRVTLNLDGVANATAPWVTTAGVTTATFTLTAPTVNGPHNLQAVWSGDANYAASTSPPVSITVGKVATVTTLTATPPTLTPGTTETLTATLAPANAVTGATFTITGSVAFYDGTALLGTAVIATNSASLSNVTLAAGSSHVLTAVYSGDANYAASTSNPVALTAALLADTVTLTVNPSSAAPGQVVTLTATVTPTIAPAATAEQNPTGNVIFYDGTKVLGTVALSASLSNTSTAMLQNATLPAGQNVLTAFYVGDLFYAPGTSNAITINVLDFSIAPSGTNSPTNLNIVKGTAGSASFVVTGLGGFNGQISVVCAVPTQDDMTCTPSPQQVVPTGTVTFTVQTFLTGGPSTAARREAPFWPRAAGGTALAGLFFLILPFGGRTRLLRESARRVLMLALLLGGITGLTTGCQSVSGGVPSSSSGTPLGVATLTITGASYVDNTVVSHSVFLTVNVLAPGTSGSEPTHGGVQ
ncbi:hypothetical protein DYQ86_14220 [Acidobacteria bacterium AB60]|nr:hypothetical protein DYQ86_14220 [Acidobacteria bacterium AB60]